MKKFALLFAIVAFGWYINLPEDMPQARLKSYNGGRIIDDGVKVGGACTQEKCLIVYVAPWCPACKSLTPMINNLVNELSRDGIKATIVVGKDTLNKVLDYSKRYNSPILADANGNFFDKVGAKGVPYFAVTNRKGKRVAEMSGGYYEVEKMRAELSI